MNMLLNKHEREKVQKMESALSDVNTKQEAIAVIQQYLEIIEIAQKRFLIEYFGEEASPSKVDDLLTPGEKETIAAYEYSMHRAWTKKRCRSLL